jgi:hypothetical protein
MKNKRRLFDGRSGKTIGRSNKEGRCRRIYNRRRII